ncbi:MAG TPA: HD domain-containing protein [Bryobacteraceae bacterium]|nr:HD domain-containing protein [Bryobacteraceae bacterium]
MGEFRDRIQNYIREQARPTEKFGHQPRLYALTLQIGEGQTYDDDVVFAAAWLHDLGVFTGHRPEEPLALANWDNTAYAMAKAPGILSNLDFPAAKCPAVVEAIRTHQPAGIPRTIEGEILRDADILEQLGAIGAVRTFCKIGRDTRFPDFTSAAASLRKALDNLPQRLHLSSARTLAQPRIAFLQALLSSLDAEAGAALY